MEKIILEKSKIVDGVMMIQASNAKIMITPRYDDNKNIIGGMIEHLNKERTVRMFFNKNYSLIPEMNNYFSEYRLNEESRNFIQECLLFKGIGNGLPIFEIKTDLENSIAKRIFRKGQAHEVILVNSHLSYLECEKVGFNKVFSGEVLTGNKNLWAFDHKFRDKENSPHPDLVWAQNVKENLGFDKSCLLCLSRRKDIKKIVGQFQKAYIGYYGLEGSKQLKWSKEFYEKEIGDYLDEFETFEGEKTLVDNSKFLVKLYIKK